MRIGIGIGLGFGQPNAFSPTSISGLVLWMDPTFGRFQETTGASATTPASAANDPIGTWLARTGQYFTAAANGNRPLVGVGANGLPFVTPDGVDDALTRTGGTAGPALAEPCHAFAGIRVNTGGVDQTILTGAIAGVGGLKLKIETANKQQPGRDGVANFGTSTTALSVGAWTRISSSFASPAGAGQCAFHLNGSADGTVATSAVAVTGDPRLFAAQPGNEFLRSSVGDILVYSRVLSAAERAQVEAFLLQRQPT